MVHNLPIQTQSMVKQMKQGQTLIAKQAFTMKVPGTRGKPVSVKVGDKFWVTSTTYSNKTQCQIDRYGKGSICNGYLISIETINSLFDMVDD